MKRWQTFLGPSRFSPYRAVVGWPEDGALPVPKDALERIAAGFGGRFKTRPGQPRAMAANELLHTLAALLLQGSRTIDAKVARAEHAVGLATWFEQGARALIEAACKIVREASEGEEPEIPLDDLKFLSPDEDELPEQTMLRGHCEDEGIFAHRVDLLDGSALLVLGSGSRQRRILGLLPDATTFAGHLSTNKNVACDLLERAGVPVPTGETVTSRDEAHAAAKRLGYPVTLKVAVGSRQRGVVPCVVSERALERALDFFGARKSKKVAQELRVERHIPGSYFRCFVAAGEFVACASSSLPTVRGDGKRTIRELIARDHAWLKAVYEKAPDLAANAEKIVRHVLVGHDLAPDDVLERGRVVPVAFSTSQGFAHDVTREVHPENRALLVRAARVLGMFWSGIDVQATRIDRPIEETKGAIIEVNDIPAFAFHGTPLPGKGPGVNMGHAIGRAFFGKKRPNVPVALVASARDATRKRLAKSIVAALERAGLRVALEGDLPPRPGPPGLHAALDPEVDAIVLAPSANVVRARGLGVPGIDALAVAGPLDETFARTLEAARRRIRGQRFERGGDSAVARAVSRRLIELAKR